MNASVAAAGTSLGVGNTLLASDGKHKTSYTSKRLLNGIETYGLPVFGVDWSRAKGVDVYNPELANPAVNFPSFEEAAAAFPNSFFVTEATGESYELQRREKVLQAFKVHGILAYCFKTQRTAWFRKEHKITTKDNAIDAEVIYRIALETRLSLHCFGPLVKNDPIRDAIKVFLVEDRYLHNGAQSEALANKYLQNLEIPDAYYEFIFPGKRKSGKARKQIGRVIAVAEGVRNAERGYREFRRQLGNYGNAFASMPRSEFYHWWTRMITNARLERHVAKSLSKLSTKQKKVHRQVLKESCVVAKWLWRLTA